MQVVGPEGGLGSCEWKGQQVCEGAVTVETKKLLQVCEGAVTFESKSLLKVNFSQHISLYNF